jgi:hypothetical protein
MKIHIDTASAEEAAKAQIKKQAGPGKPGQTSGKGKTTAGKKGSSGSGTPAQGQPAQPKKVKPKPLPKVQKETKPPADVADARKRQTSVLKERGKREVQGKFKGPSRDVDAGTGFGFQTYPFL